MSIKVIPGKQAIALLKKCKEFYNKSILENLYRNSTYSDCEKLTIQSVIDFLVDNLTRMIKENKCERIYYDSDQNTFVFQLPCDADKKMYLYFDLGGFHNKINFEIEILDSEDKICIAFCNQYCATRDISLFFTYDPTCQQHQKNRFLLVVNANIKYDVVYYYYSELLKLLR